MISRKLKMKLVSLVVGVVTMVASMSPAMAAGKKVRLAGHDRYDTCIAVSNEYVKGNPTDTCILVSGENYPDAVCSAPLTKAHNAPIMLTQEKVLTPRIEAQMNKLGIKKVVIVGGTGVVSQGIEDKLKAKGMKVTRLGGKDRFQTSYIVARYLFDNFGDKVGGMYVGTSDYNDCLAFGAKSALHMEPIVLVKDDVKFIDDTPELRRLLNDYKINDQDRDSFEKFFDERHLGVNYGFTDDKCIFFGLNRINTNKYQSNDNIVFATHLSNANAIMACGDNYPDALCGTALAGKLGAPI